MNHSQLVLDQVRAMGLIMRDARLARDINPRDLETELRTTYRHLLAIEEGQMRLFYSDSFFCDLFTRYAVQLGFSAEQAHEMRLALSGEGPLVEPAVAELEPESEQELPLEPGSAQELPSEPGSEQVQAPLLEPAAGAMPAPASEPQSEPGQPVEADIPLNPAEASPSSPLVETPTPNPTPPFEQHDLEPKPVLTRSSDASQSLGSLWFWGAIAIGLVLAVVILTLEPTPEASTTVAAEKAQVLSKPPQTEKPSPPPEQTPVPAEEASPASPAAADPIAASSATAEAQQEPVAAPPPEPPKERRISESILVSALNAPTSFITGSAMAIRFNVKGWVWVREFDDNVREFVVQPGQTVRFNDLPIFIVVPFPDQLTATVSDQSVTLRRNDDEKNHARYSRSMLRGLVNNP